MAAKLCRVAIDDRCVWELEYYSEFKAGEYWDTFQLQTNTNVFVCVCVYVYPHVYTYTHSFPDALEGLQIALIFQVPLHTVKRIMSGDSSGNSK